MLLREFECEGSCKKSPLVLRTGPRTCNLFLKGLYYMQKSAYLLGKRISDFWVILHLWIFRVMVEGQSHELLHLVSILLFLFLLLNYTLGLSFFVPLLVV